MKLIPRDCYTQRSQKLFLFLFLVWHLLALTIYEIYLQVYVAQPMIHILIETNNNIYQFFFYYVRRRCNKPTSFFHLNLQHTVTQFYLLLNISSSSFILEVLIFLSWEWFKFAKTVKHELMTTCLQQPALWSPS